MAIYHVHVQVIKRSQGKSAVAAAAYRHASKIKDEKNDKIHDYTRKTGVVYSSIMAPLHAPKWVENRTQLWNEIEKKENRKDAQLSREMDIALPKELSKKDHVNMVRRFSHEQFVKKGMIADIAIHYPKDKEGKNYNPHAHIMLTMREISKEGFGKKNRDWNDRKTVNEIRAGWEKEANESLKRRNIKDSLTHKRTRNSPAVHYGKRYNYYKSRDKKKSIQELGKELKRIDIEIARKAREVKEAIRVQKEKEEAEKRAIEAKKQEEEARARQKQEEREAIEREKIRDHRTYLEMYEQSLESNPDFLRSENEKFEMSLSILKEEYKNSIDKIYNPELKRAKSEIEKESKLIFKMNEKVRDLRQQNNKITTPFWTKSKNRKQIDRYLNDVEYAEERRLKNKMDINRIEKRRSEKYKEINHYIYRDFKDLEKYEIASNVKTKKENESIQRKKELNRNRGLGR